MQEAQVALHTMHNLYCVGIHCLCEVQLCYCMKHMYVIVGSTSQFLMGAQVTFEKKFVKTHEHGISLGRPLCQNATTKIICNLARFKRCFNLKILSQKKESSTLPILPWWKNPTKLHGSHKRYICAMPHVVIKEF